jgi:hypothetical protein
VGHVGQVLQEVKDRTEQLEDTAQEGKMLNEYREAASALLLDPKWSPMEPRARAEGQRDALKDLSASYTDKINEKIVTPAIRVRATGKLGAWASAVGVQQQENAQKESVQWSLNQHEVDTEKNRQQVLAAPDADTRVGVISDFTNRQAALRNIGAITPGQEEHGLRKFMVQVEDDRNRQTIEMAEDPKRAYKDIIAQDSQRDPAHVLRLTDNARRDLFNWSNAVENAKYSDELKKDRAEQKAIEKASETHFTRLQAGLVAAYKANDMGAVKQLKIEADALPLDKFTTAHRARLFSTDHSLSDTTTGKDDPNALKQLTAMATSKYTADGQVVDRVMMAGLVAQETARGRLTEGSGATIMGTFDTTKIPEHNANDRAAVTGLTRDVGQLEIDTNALKQSADAAGTREATIRNMQAEAIQLFTAHRAQFPNGSPEDSAAYALDAVKKMNATLLKKLDVASFARDFPEQARGLNPDLPLAPQIGEMHRQGKFSRERAPEVLQYLKNEAAEKETFKRKQAERAGVEAQKLVAPEEPGIVTRAWEAIAPFLGMEQPAPKNLAGQLSELQRGQSELDALKKGEAGAITQGWELIAPFLGVETATPEWIKAEISRREQRLSDLRAGLPIPEREAQRMIELHPRLYGKPDGQEKDPTKRAILQAEWNTLAVKHGALLGIPAPAAPGEPAPTGRPPVAPAPGPAPARLDTDALLGAIAKNEGGNNPNAIGKDGEIGMYQMMPATARALGYDPEAMKGNAAMQEEAARTHLENLRKIFPDDDQKVIAAWNAGAGGVQKAVEKAGPGGDWKQFLPKGTSRGGAPYDTRSYLNRAMEFFLEPEKPRASAPGPSPSSQIKGSVFDTMLDALVRQTEQAGKMTKGPFHVQGGVDQAAGGALDIAGVVLGGAARKLRRDAPKLYKWLHKRLEVVQAEFAGSGEMARATADESGGVVKGLTSSGEFTAEHRELFERLSGKEFRADVHTGLLIDAAAGAGTSTHELLHVALNLKGPTAFPNSRHLDTLYRAAIRQDESLTLLHELGVPKEEVVIEWMARTMRAQKGSK